MRFFLRVFIFLCCVLAQGQEQQQLLNSQFGTPNPTLTSSRFLFSGVVRSIATGAPLSGVSVLVPQLKVGVSTNPQGVFSLSLPYGVHEVRFEALGYASKTIRIALYAKGQLSINLEEEEEALDEVVVVNRTNDNLESDMVGKASLSALETKNIPLVLGEQNILKAATILPGISTTGEAATGYNVRGGKADQNLILLNQAIIVNPNHFFGIFQALNPFAINTLNVYKGSIPIAYEGRTSSVFEITTKTPSTATFKGEIALGPITANALLEAPIKKGKSGIMIGLRSAHSDWILRALNDPKLQKSSASFYDGILTYEDQLSKKDNLSATYYHSNDAFSISSDSLFKYSNSLASVNWKHQFNAEHSMQLHLSSSDYDFGIHYEGGNLNNFESGFKMQIKSMRLKFNRMLSPKHSLTYGTNAVYYEIAPGTIRPLSAADLIRPQKLMLEKALEGSVFIADRIVVSEALALNFGVQLAIYAAFGPYQERSYEAGVPITASAVIASTSYNNNQSFAKKLFPAYRFSARYKLNDALSFKLAALRMYQFIHSLTNNTTASPIDTWRISTNNLPPQASDQLAVGLFLTPLNKAFDLSVEGFYKRQQNLVDFKTGAELFLNQFIETEVLQGKGKAYGVEFLLRKKTGKHTGWLGYTYSRTLIQLESPFREEQVNNGAFFPTNYDKPHDLSIIWNYAFSPTVNFSTNLIYQTGRPITIPNGNYQFNNAEYVLFSDRNQYRIPDFYRIDLGLNYTPKAKQSRRIVTSWSLSVYNVFGRNNPFSVYFISDEGKIKGKKSSIFAVPIPSLTFNLKF